MCSESISLMLTTKNLKVVKILKYLSQELCVGILNIEKVGNIKTISFLIKFEFLLRFSLQVLYKFKACLLILPNLFLL